MGPSSALLLAAFLGKRFSLDLIFAERKNVDVCVHVNAALEINVCANGSYKSDWEVGLFTPTHLLKQGYFVLNDICIYICIYLYILFVFLKKKMNILIIIINKVSKSEKVSPRLLRR